MVVASIGAVRTYAASRAVIDSNVMGSEEKMIRAIELAPWDHVLRGQYLNMKIGFEWPTVTGSDATASAAMLNSLDAQVRGAILDFPDELTLYTLLVDVWANAKEAPGYDTLKHESAATLAAQKFPNDPEVQRRMREAPTAPYPRSSGSAMCPATYGNPDRA